MIISLEFITDFGDSAVTGAIAVVLAVALLLTNNRRAALAMLLAFGISAFFIAVAKIVFYDCWLESPAAGLRSPSGHAAISTAVYGTLVIIGASSLKARYRIPAYILTAGFVGLIAITRIVLGRHSPIEVICGLLVGGAVCVIVSQLCLRQRPVIINHIAFFLITLFAIIVVHGIRLPAETLIDNIAGHFGHLEPGCVKK